MNMEDESREELEEYHNQLVDFLESRGEQKQSFCNYLCSIFEEQGYLDGYEIVNFSDLSNPRKQMAVDAWSHNRTSNTLTLFIVDYREGRTVNSAGKEDFTRHYKRLERFFDLALSDNYAEAFPAGTPVADLADLIRSFAEAGDEKSNLKVRLYYLTNSVLKTRMTQLDQALLSQDIECSYEIWDLSRLFKIESSESAHEDIEIDFEDFGIKEGLPALMASGSEGALQSYLLAMNGNLIAQLYDKYGERLLEQNVRTFLQFRGNVNKGMRNTIKNEPNMFFAFNNGLTATADYVDFDPDSKTIRSIHNLQIVNGGQTAASIFASKMLRTDVDNVYVQVKLTLVTPEDAEEIVPRISLFANTQNKVNVSDLSSNHPFHQRIQTYSRNLSTKSTGIGESKWFYERTRGQYGNIQLKLSASKKKEFQQEYPKRQMFAKTDLAKFENSFAEKPHIVALAAQKNYIKYIEEVVKIWNKNESSYNELFFKRLIGKAIAFKALEGQILKQTWYDGYRSQIVTYTLALFAQAIRKTSKAFKFEQLWIENAAPDELTEHLLKFAEAVNGKIKMLEGGQSNIAEWCKKELCWQKVQELDIPYPSELKYLLVDPQATDNVIEEKKAKANAKDLNNINAVMEVYNRGPEFWCALLEWNSTMNKLMPKENRWVQKASRGMPTDDWEAKGILSSLERCESAGFFFKS
jgi:hypothetical protein